MEVVGFSDELQKVDSRVRQMLDQNAIIRTISADSRISEVNELQYLDIPMYHTAFLYLQADSGEFLIPYGSRPDLTGLENGKLYQAAQAVSILKQNFAGGSTGEENGGGPSTEGPPAALIITVSLLAVALIGTGIVMRTLRSKRQKHL